jgi:hypothetical protein
MPPEVMEAGDYNSSLDVFSFGHLMLFTIIGEVPGSLLGPTYSDLDGIRGRSEIDRRRKYVVKSQKQLGQTHPLNILMEGCLRNVPSKRPSTEVLVQTLCHVMSNEEIDFNLLLQAPKEKQVMNTQCTM